MFRLFRKKDSKKDKNDHMRTALAKEGDDGTAPRQVRHFVHPVAGGATNATVVHEFLVMNGFSVEPESAKEGFFAKERREVASPDFDARTIMLTKSMAQWNWTYDGWECAVTPN